MMRWVLYLCIMCGYVMKRKIAKEISQCGGTVRSSDVDIRYPLTGAYQSKRFCLWDIRINEPIYLVFTRFDLEYSRTCLYDYLKVEIGGNKGEKYCGRSPPSRIITSHKEIRLIFRSDSMTEASGFTLQIRPATCSTICDGNATCYTIHGLPYCRCNIGFVGDGEYCERPQNCRQKRSCHFYASCDTGYDPPRCICASGYSGNGTSCVRSTIMSPRISYEGIGAFAAIVFIVIICGKCYRCKATRSRTRTTTTNAVQVLHVGRQHSLPENSQSGNQVPPRRASTISNPLPGTSQLSDISTPPPTYQPYFIPDSAVPPPKETSGNSSTASATGYVPPEPPPAYTPRITEYAPPTGSVPTSLDLPPPPSYEDVVNDAYQT